MRIDVRFMVPFSQSMPLRFGGRGSIHLLETAMIAEGLCSDVFVPLVSWAVRPITSHWTMRTIPYSAIVRHEVPRFPKRRSHHIHYMDIDGHVLAVGFQIVRRRQFTTDKFTKLLQEYREALQGETDARSAI